MRFCDKEDIERYEEPGPGKIPFKIITITITTTPNKTQFAAFCLDSNDSIGDNRHISRTNRMKRQQCTTFTIQFVRYQIYVTEIWKKKIIENNKSCNQITQASDSVVSQ